MRKPVFNRLEVLSHHAPFSPSNGLSRTVPAASIRHQFVSIRLAAALLLYAESANIGQVLQKPCDVVLSREITLQPDIFFIANERSGLLEKACLRGAPDVAIEILSPASREIDLGIRRKLYSRFRVKEYWTVDPDSESVEVLLWSEMGYASNGIYGKSDSLSSPVMPELGLAVKRIFV